MKEIKFRAWDKKRNRWVEFGNGGRMGYSSFTTPSINISEDNKVISILDNWFYSDDYEVEWCQYTGRKARLDNKEIYEGCIVEVDKNHLDKGQCNLAIVEYELTGQYVLKGINTPFQMPLFRCDKVIGSKFEHPALLKDNNE